jgi:hypothetical protein
MIKGKVGRADRENSRKKERGCGGGFASRLAAQPSSSCFSFALARAQMLFLAQRAKNTGAYCRQGVLGIKRMLQKMAILVAVFMVTDVTFFASPLEAKRTAAPGKSTIWANITAKARLKRFLIMAQVDSIGDAISMRGQYVSLDVDMLVLVCSDKTPDSGTSLIEFAVQLPSLAPTGLTPGCGDAWQVTHNISRVSEVNGSRLEDSTQVFRTGSCTPDIAEFILSIAAHTGPAYSFYVPLIGRPNVASNNESQPQPLMLEWLSEFAASYGSASRREQMAEMSVTALHRRLLALARALGMIAAEDLSGEELVTLPMLPPASCAIDARRPFGASEKVAGQKDRELSPGGHAGPIPRASRRPSQKRFVYLATGHRPLLSLCLHPIPHALVLHISKTYKQVTACCFPSACTLSRTHLRCRPPLAPSHIFLLPAHVCLWWSTQARELKHASCSSDRVWTWLNVNPLACTL